MAGKKTSTTPAKKSDEGGGWFSGWFGGGDEDQTKKGNAAVTSALPKVKTDPAGTPPGGGVLDAMKGNGVDLKPGATTTPVPPAQDPAKQPQIDPKKITATSDKLFKAMDGWGTDEAAVLGALKGLSAAEIDAVKAEYAAHYGGRDLLADIEGELGGDDWKEAQAHLSGNEAEGALMALNNAVGFFNDDEAKIEETLRGLSPDALKELQEKAGTDPKYKDILAKVGDNLGGSDKEVMDALLDGDKAKADAIRIDDAMGSSKSIFNPTAWGTDEEAINKILEDAAKDTSDPDRLKKLEEQFNSRMSAAGEKTDLRAQLGDELGNNDKDISMSLLEGDLAGADAARLHKASDRWGTDEQQIFGVLADDPTKSAEENAAYRQQIIEKYEKEHGSLKNMLDNEMDGNDQTRAEMLMKDGKMDPAFALHYAMDGLGTDESMIEEQLKGKSAEEIAEIRKNFDEKYGAEHGGNLDAAFDGELSGRSEFSTSMLMKGEPKTPEEQYARAKEWYDYERGDANWFSRTMMDASEAIGMHSKGEMLDLQMARMNDMFDENGALKQGVDAAQVSRVYNWQETDTTNYQEAKDSVADALATTAAVAGSVIATIATAGTASPVLVAALSGLVGMGAKAGIQGGAYIEDVGIDLLTTALSTATAGIADMKAVSAYFDDIGKIFGPELLQKVVAEGAKSGASDAVMGLYGGIMNEDRWRQGMEEWGLGILGDTAQSGVKGLVGGGAGEAVKEGMGPLHTNYFKQAGVSATSSTVGNLAGELADLSTYDKGFDQAMEDLGTGSAKTFATSGVKSFASRFVRVDNIHRKLLDGKDPSEIDAMDHLYTSEMHELIGKQYGHAVDNNEPDWSVLDND